VNNSISIAADFFSAFHDAASAVFESFWHDMLPCSLCPFAEQLLTDLLLSSAHDTSAAFQRVLILAFSEI